MVRATVVGSANNRDVFSPSRSTPEENMCTLSSKVQNHGFAPIEATGNHFHPQ